MFETGATSYHVSKELHRPYATVQYWRKVWEVEQSRLICSEEAAVRQRAVEMFEANTDPHGAHPSPGVLDVAKKLNRDYYEVKLWFREWAAKRYPGLVAA
jgi:hypothetical protein